MSLRYVVRLGVFYDRFVRFGLYGVIGSRIMISTPPSRMPGFVCCSFSSPTSFPSLLLYIHRSYSLGRAVYVFLGMLLFVLCFFVYNVLFGVFCQGYEIVAVYGSYANLP